MKRKFAYVSLVLSFILLFTSVLAVVPAYAESETKETIETPADIFTTFGSPLNTDLAYYRLSTIQNVEMLVEAQYKLGLYGTGVPVAVAMATIGPSSSVLRFRVYVANNTASAALDGKSINDIETAYNFATYNGYTCLRIRPSVATSDTAKEYCYVSSYELNTLGLPSPTVHSSTGASEIYSYPGAQQYLWPGSHVMLEYGGTPGDLIAVDKDNDDHLGDFGFYENGTNTYMGFSATTKSLTELYLQRNYSVGYNEGYADGLDQGYNDGYNVGLDNGYDEGYGDGRGEGFRDGYDVGYTEGQNAGYDEGYEEGVTAGNNAGYTDGYNQGYAQGEADGYTQGFIDGSPAEIDVAGVISSIPLSAKSIINNAFGFELFGINIAGLLSVLLIVSIIGFVVKWLMSR